MDSKKGQTNTGRFTKNEQNANINNTHFADRNYNVFDNKDSVINISYVSILWTTGLSVSMKTTANLK